MDFIYELIDTYEDKLIACWMAALQQAEGPTLSSEGAAAQASAFLRELRAALASAVAEDAAELARESAPERDDRPGAAVDVLAQTRAFGALHCMMLELAADHGMLVSAPEQLTLASYINSAVARAAELGRGQHDEQVWRVAHQLRNPLGAAMMALTLLRSRVDLGANARLGDTLERNLKRIQGLIDVSVAEHRRPPEAPVSMAEPASP